MTWPVITLTEEDTVAQAARTLQSHGVKRAPVLREGVIVGIVTRSDLLRPYLRTDLEIQADVEEALFGDSLELRGDEVNVGVSKGVVRLEGRARDSQQRALAVRLARSVDGVMDVEDEFGVAAVRTTTTDAGEAMNR
jgi:CBS domain-containing protein